jgi:hypothetical protein
MPTPHIFDFDETLLANYQPEKIDKLLIEQPTVYVNHLRIAHNLDAQAERLKSGTFSKPEGFENDEYQKGYAQALRGIAAHLRQGNYVEGFADYFETT